MFPARPVLAAEAQRRLKQSSEIGGILDRESPGGIMTPWVLTPGLPAGLLQQPVDGAPIAIDAPLDGHELAERVEGVVGGAIAELLQPCVDELANLPLIAMLVEIVHGLHNRQTGAFEIEAPHLRLQVGHEIPGGLRWGVKTQQPVDRGPLRLGAGIVATSLQPHQLPQLFVLEVQGFAAPPQSLVPSRQKVSIHGDGPVSWRARWV